jgi:outer membrane immunogenic protein
MNKILLVLIAIAPLALAANAQAADMPVKAPFYKAPPPPVYSWQGFYIGGHAGYLWSSTEVFDDGVLVEPHASTNGFVGGLLGGYNWQSGIWVFGLEGDFGWSTAHGTGVTAEPVPVINANTYDIDWTAHTRGRLGIVPTSAPLLFFIAGGAAFSRFVLTDGETAEKTAATYTGASVGVGVDFAATNQILLRAEWLHDFYDMGSALAVAGDYTAKLQNIDTARGGLIIKF